VIGGKKRIGLGLGLLLAVAFANRAWFMAQMPLSADELFSLEHFIRPGLKVALTDYSSPNNHVLNSLLSALALLFPVSESIAIRITALVASLASALVMFRMVLGFQSARFAFFSAGVWMASLGALYYGSVSRGHALVAFFALTAYYALRKLLSGTPAQVKWSAVFVVSSALGFLAVPTFLLPFLGLMLTMLVHWLMRKDMVLMKINLINTALSIAAALLLYIPVLRNNQITALTDNWLIRDHDLANFSLARIYAHTQETLTYFDPLVVALFIPLAAIAIWLQKEWKGGFMSQALLMLAVSLAYVAFSGIIPPSRTLVFMAPFIIMAVSEGLFNGYHQVSQRYRKGMMVLIALLPILVLVNSNKAMYRSSGIDSRASALQEVPEVEAMPLQNNPIQTPIDAQ